MPDSLDRKVPKLNGGWCRRFYSALSQSLFDPPADSSSEALKHFANNRKRYATTLAQLEVFVDATIEDRALAASGEISEGSSLNFPALRSAKYFRSIPDFIRVVCMLSDLYTYNEHINVFKACCERLGLMDRKFSWLTLRTASLDSRSPETVFIKLVRMVREECLASSIRLAVAKRRHEAWERFEDYCDYFDACFNKHARLVFIRVDLYYQSGSADQITAQQATDDLDHMLENRRHNTVFRGWVGYVAKLEYGVQKRLHWHLLVIFDGRTRDGASHVDIARKIGEYWKKRVTNGRGAYWNCNASSKDYLQRNICGIGPISYADMHLRQNLELEVLNYLTKTTQLLRPKFGKDVKTIRRGQFPKVAKGSKRGRKRSLVERIHAGLYYQ